LLGFLVGEAFVGFADLDKFSVGLWVVLIAIGVVLECEFPVCFFDGVDGGV
jgi:hypothetical protein